MSGFYPQVAWKIPPHGAAPPPCQFGRTGSRHCGEIIFACPARLGTALFLSSTVPCPFPSNCRIFCSFLFSPCLVVRFYFHLFRVAILLLSLCLPVVLLSVLLCFIFSFLFQFLAFNMPLLFFYFSLAASLVIL
jgi:hypothetical protein